MLFQSHQLMFGHLLQIFALSTLAGLFYWAIIRPFILDSAVDELRRMRSKLDWAIINKEAGATTEGARELSKHLEFYEWVRINSFSNAIFFRFTRRAEVKAEAARAREIFDNSPIWIRNMSMRENQVCMKAALANSPAWWIPLAAILLGTVFSMSLQQWWEETEMAAGKLKCDRLPSEALTA
jgi:hypothetical protein